MASGPGGRSSAGFGLAVAGLFAAYLASALYFTVNGRLNLDEGWYLYAARLVYEGRLPYRDFAFFQAPLLPFVYGLPQHLIGASVEVGRLTSLLLGVATLALGARLSFERGGRCGTLLFLALPPVTPLLVWTYTTTRTEPLNAFLLTLSAFCLFRPDPGPRSGSVAGVAVVLAAATRIASLPVAFLLLTRVAHRHRASRRELAIALGPAFLLVALFGGMVYAAGPDVVLFDLVTRQTERHTQLQGEAPWTLAQLAARRVADLSVVRSYYGGVPLISFACALGVAAAWLTRRRRGGFEQQASALAAFAFAAYLPNLAPRNVFPLYFSSVFPLFLVLMAWCVGHLFARVPREGRNAISAGAVMLVVFHLGTTFGQKQMHLSQEFNHLAGLREAAEYIARVVPPDRTLATTDTYLAVESGRRVPPGWEMSIFSFFPARSRDDGRRLGLLTKARLDATFREPSLGAVALSDHSLGVLVRRSFSGYRRDQRLGENALHAALPASRRFRLDRVFEGFGQFEDRLYVLLPTRR